MDEKAVLHVVMFPWLAIGHLIPFLELSKCLAQKGHRVSFISTPRNIQRLPKIPPHLSPLITLVSFPLPPVHGLPHHAESSADIPLRLAQHLKKAFDGLQPSVAAFLQNSIPDWILYDYASHWLPQLASQLGVPSAFFSLFNAAMLAFIGPPQTLLSGKEEQMKPEDLTVVPSWIPFPSTVAYRLHEVLPFFEVASTEILSGVSDFYRFGMAIRDCDFVALRSCLEFEPEYINFLSVLYEKPLILVGSIHPSLQLCENEEDEKWIEIRDWFDKQRPGSVVYVAIGTESPLSLEQLHELALGLELSELPFFWVLRNEPGSTEDQSAMLPEGFKDRIGIGGKGVIYTSWAPQVRILAHSSIGGFLTHCGWNSVIEGLGFGRALVLLPILNDQGLTARLLEEKKLGVEIPRYGREGSFTSESVAESLRLVMVDEEGEVFRTKAREMREVFANKNKMDRDVEGFVNYLLEHRRRNGTSSST